MLKSANMQDVADAAGVSKATVSLVLRNEGGISPPTRERVLAAARKLNYRLLSLRGRSAGSDFGQIALFFLSEDPPRMNGQAGASYLHAMIEGCLDEAQRLGRSVVTCTATFDQVRAGNLPVALHRGHLDGLLFRGWFLPEIEKVFGELGLPLVLVDSDRRVQERPQVQIDNIQAMRDLVEHLLARGARRLATITGDMDHLNAQERLAGLQLAARMHGLALPEENIALDHGFSEDSGRHGAAELLRRGCAFDALVCQNDLIAAGALEALRGAGRRVPEDVRLTGFDNMDLAERLPVPLTSVDSDTYLLGQTGARLLAELFAAPDARPLLIRTPARLVVRASSGGA